MNFAFPFILALSVLLPTATSRPSSARKESKKPAWQADYPSARLAAVQTGKPIFIIFR